MADPDTQDSPRQNAAASLEHERFSAVGRTIVRSSFRRGQSLFALNLLQYDPGGDGVVFLGSHGRLVGDLHEQWASLREPICERPLRPRIIIVGMGFNGALEPGQRHDLARLIDCARKDWCHWVAARDMTSFCYGGPRHLAALLAWFGTEIYLSRGYGTFVPRAASAVPHTVLTLNGLDRGACVLPAGAKRNRMSSSLK